jgi:ABC-type uncharacterized transport system substrate-binding protein
MIKKLVLILLALSIFLPLQSQSLSQIGFVIKKALPNVENIAVIYPSLIKDQIVSQAKTAQLITKKKFSVYGVSNKGGLSKELFNIKRMSNLAVIVITNESTLTPDIIPFILGKLDNKVPVISNRSKDTLQGALLSVFSTNGTIEKHINMIVAAAMGLTIPEEFMAECVIDVE